MEKVLAALHKLREINTTHKLKVEAIDGLLAEIPKAKVCTPIIGKFSTGKSALINTILGFKRGLLKTDLTPQTAIPAEIVYTEGEDRVTISAQDDTFKQLTIAEYKDYEADASTAKSALLELRNTFLAQIPDVMLVDMPGFESASAIHNRVIDDYLPQSLAYLITFTADDLIVRSSMGDILRELCLHDMPLCVVITKYDKHGDDYENTLAKLKESLQRFVGARDITYCKSSSFNGDVEEVREYLRGIQTQAQELLAREYKKRVLPLVENTRNYLVKMQNDSKLSASELDEQEERLQQQLASLDKKFSQEQQTFEGEIEDAVAEVKADIQKALEREEAALVGLALNEQDISERLNALVRSAVTVSVQRNLIPRVERYLKRVAKALKSEAIANVNIAVAFDTDKINKGMTGTVVAVAAGWLLGGPIGALLAGLFMKNRKEKQREEARQAIRRQLRTEVFPQVLEEVGGNVEAAIRKEVGLVNSSVEEELANQRSTLEKAMADLRQQMNEEKARKEDQAQAIQEALKEIEDIKNDLQ